MIFSIILLSCQSEELATRSPSTLAPAQKIADTPSSSTLVRRLSVRDTGLDCKTLEAVNLREELTYVVENVSRPPWAGMRAAACLAELFPNESKTDFVRWVKDPNTKGLAFLLAGQLEKLPDPVAIDVAEAALSGPHAPDFRIRLEKVNDIRMKELLEK
ncbi:MAG: hypothetical protein VX278_22290 [Myxococcota bacterium]|nr:hypothetical protein [Myxococcota bacterium]